MLLIILASLTAIFGCNKLIRFLNAKRAFSTLPQLVCPLEPLSIPGSVMPTTWWNPGLCMPWNKRARWYSEYNSEAVIIVPWLVGVPSLYTCSPEIMKHVLGPGSTFVKPMRATAGLLVFGQNVIASDGEDWRRHRRITAPAFSQRTYETVWQETTRVYQSILQTDSWANQDEVQCLSFDNYTTKIALFIISAIGFDIPLEWSEAADTEKAFLQKNITAVAKNIIPRVVIPKWAYHLPIKALKTIDSYYKDFSAFMNGKVAARTDEVRKQLAVDPQGAEASTADILGRLVVANELSGGTQLSDEEIIGNSFAFMFAGHETTANTLAATLAMLAIEEKEQENVFKCIEEIVGDRDPTLEDYPALEPVLWCFYEALRLYPSAYITIRVAVEDTELGIPDNNTGKEQRVIIPKGTIVNLDVIGINHNPRYFPDPLVFRPSRFRAGSATPAPVLTFSSGPRVCLGRRFASIEAVCFLTHILRDYKVEPILRPGETAEDWKKRVLAPTIGITLAFSDVPLRFIKRRGG